MSTLELRGAPHVQASIRTDSIMWNVVLALLPVTGFALWSFGLGALLTLGMAVGSCVATEALVNRVQGRATISDGSAVITGLLFGLTLPPGLPLWMTAVGGVLCMGLGKHAFGGLGSNPFNPALVGRAVLQAAFPVPMTTWVAAGAPGRFSGLPDGLLALPLTRPVAADALSSATPLSGWKFEGLVADGGDLLLGLVPGSVGETCAVAVAAGGLYLLARGMINWRIPAAVLGSAALLTAALRLAWPETYPGATFTVGAGGLMLGAFFMATDYVGSPMDGRGMAVYGVLIGVLTVVIRFWGGMPEGLMYAILLGNAATPHIDRWFQPRVFGTPVPEST